MASYRPRIEEVDDEDDFDVDNMEFDPADYDPRASIIRPADIPTTVASADTLRQQAHPSTFPQPPAHAHGPPLHDPITSSGFGRTKIINKEEMSTKFRFYQTVYPIYFDLSRSKNEGRRVSKSNAVANPLAREIVAALNSLELQTVFEPTKFHPKDWTNPGRVKVLLKKEGEAVHPLIKNKRQLYAQIGQWLQRHPTTAETPLLLKFHGMPHPDKPPPPPAVPRGWKINEILPLHSPALSGGGVSDNIFKEMMNEMGGGGGVGGSALEERSASGGEKKKDKKKKK